MAAAVALWNVLIACVPNADLGSYSEGTGGSASASSGAGGTSAGGAGAAPSSGGTSSIGGSGFGGSVPGDGPSEADASAPNLYDASPPQPDSGGLSVPCAGGLYAPQLGTCYFVSTEPASWLAAASRCAEAGQTLVKISSAEEDAFVGAASGESLWIGASDVRVDNFYVWSDGSPILFGNWGPAQPDAFPGPDCIEKRQEPSEPWYDQPCGNERTYVCEAPASID